MFKAAWGGPPRFIGAWDEWLLLRWFPPSAYGEPEDWYLPRWENGELEFSYAVEFQEDYPSSGDYEIEFAFGVFMPFDLAIATEKIQKFLGRPPLPSRAQRRLKDEAILEAAKERKFQEDWARLNDATPAFGGAEMVGYGGKSAEAPALPEKELTPAIERKIWRMTATRAARLERSAALA